MGLLVLKEAQGKTKHWDQVLSLDSSGFSGWFAGFLSHQTESDSFLSMSTLDLFQGKHSHHWHDHDQFFRVLICLVLSSLPFLLGIFVLYVAGREAVDFLVQIETSP